MVITDKVELPDKDSTRVHEVCLSYVTILTAAPYIGKACETVNNEFMLCRQETGDPRVCLDLGKSVTSCTLDFFKKLKANCRKEFNQYSYCLDKSSGNGSYSLCRKTQEVFDDCVKDKLGLDRPHFGYFCRGRVHETARPKPIDDDPCPPPDATPSLPDEAPRLPARFQSRHFWVNE